MTTNRFAGLVCLTWVLACDPGGDDESPDSAGQATGVDSGPADGDSGDDPPADGLGGRTFLSTKVAGFVLVEGTQVRLSFLDSGELSASGGCNGMGAEQWSVTEGVLEVGNLWMTEKGCEGRLHEQDDWLADLLTSRPMVSLEGDMLTLHGESSVLVMLDREVADPDRALTGGVWEVDAIIDGLGAGWGGPLPTMPTLRFADDGTLAIQTPCRTGEASYTVEGSMLTLSDVSMTDEACPEIDSPEAMMLVDSHMQNLFVDGEFTVDIEAAMLAIDRGDQGIRAKATW